MLHCNKLIQLYFSWIKQDSLQLKLFPELSYLWHRNCVPYYSVKHNESFWQNNTALKKYFILYNTPKITKRLWCPYTGAFFPMDTIALSVIQRLGYPGCRVLVHPGKKISHGASSVLILKTALPDNKMSFREAGKNEKAVSRNYTIKNKPRCDHLFVPNLRCSLFHLVDGNTLRQT